MHVLYFDHWKAFVGLNISDWVFFFVCGKKNEEALKLFLADPAI